MKEDKSLVIVLTTTFIYDCIWLKLSCLSKI